MRFVQTRKCHADANANADANRMHTKNNMSPSPSVGDINEIGEKEMKKKQQSDSSIHATSTHCPRVYQLSTL